MVVPLTEVPVREEGEDLLPDNRFRILFDLEMERQPRKWRTSVMLMMTWEAPVLPGPGDIIHVGRGGYDVVIQMPKRDSSSRSWGEGGCITLRARLLHLTDPQMFMERMQKLIDDFPEYRTRLHATMHIFTAMSYNSH